MLRGTNFHLFAHNFHHTDLGFPTALVVFDVASDYHQFFSPQRGGVPRGSRGEVVD